MGRNKQSNSNNGRQFEINRKDELKKNISNSKKAALELEALEDSKESQKQHLKYAKSAYQKNPFNKNLSMKDKSS
jgi:hypothetical protein